MGIEDIRDALIIRERSAYLLTDPTGNVAGGNVQGFGLYHRDARHLSKYEFDLNGIQPVVLLSTAELGYAMEQVLRNPTLKRPYGARPSRFASASSSIITCLEGRAAVVASMRLPSSTGRGARLAPRCSRTTNSSTVSCCAHSTTFECCAARTSRAKHSCQPARHGSTLCSAATAASSPCKHCHTTRRSPERRSVSWHAPRALSSTRSATRSRARSCTSCDSTSCPPPASSHTALTTAASTRRRSSCSSSPNTTTGPPTCGSCANCCRRSAQLPSGW